MIADRNVSTQHTGMIEAYGGALVDLMAPAEQQQQLRSSASKTIECSDRNACDVELLIVGGFSPERGFMCKADYETVVSSYRTASGRLFGLPIVMDTNREDIVIGDRLLLTYRGQDLAILHVEDFWEPDKVIEAKSCYKTTALEHPAVRMIAMERGRFYIGGAIEGLELPRRIFPCLTPAQTRAMLPASTDVVAFQCRNPIHRAHYELLTRALQAPNVGSNAVVLVHPTCGPTQQDDISAAVRHQTYERLAAELSNPRILWAYLPYSMHMAGPREALQHMIIRRNYGCSHFIIGRDMAGCKSSLSGEDFYGPYDAQKFASSCAPELMMKTIPSLNLVYTDEEGYVTAEHAKARGLHVKKLSGTQFRKLLRSGEDIPEWFAFRSVVEVLRAAT
ncbi:sulfate adenylyltransferase [cyanobiont of Ornithocercus magnificus]|nr:sulfate adenylyltransferase [cyanobiont of Ornithocercus magnificus]